MCLYLFVYIVVITVGDNEYVKPVVKSIWKHNSSGGSIQVLVVSRSVCNNGVSS